MAVLNQSEKTLDICLAGKYTELEDCYLSVVEACVHAGVHYDIKVHVHWLDTVKVEEKGQEYIKLFFEENSIK